MISSSPQGEVADGFEGIRDAFLLNFKDGMETGAAFCVMRRGECLAHLYAGHATTSGAPITARALFNLNSTTKGLTALAVAMLVDRGKLDYEAPLADYWSDFGEAGKSSFTLGQVMSHQGGLCGLRESATIEDFYAHEYVAKALAAQRPFFVPGVYGYHPLTFGTIAEEVVRRTTDRTLSDFFSEEVAKPLDLDIHFGIRHDDEARLATTLPPPPQSSSEIPPPPNPEAARAAFENPPLSADWANTAAWRRAGLASAGASGEAKSLARLYDVLAAGGVLDGSRIASSRTLHSATMERVSGIDQSAGVSRRYAAGFVLNIGGRMGPNPASFGHGGWGGSLAFADPDQGVGVAYVMNQMIEPPLGQFDQRVTRLVEATFIALRSS